MKEIIKINFKKNIASGLQMPDFYLFTFVFYLFTFFRWRRFVIRATPNHPWLGN